MLWVLKKNCLYETFGKENNYNFTVLRKSLTDPVDEFVMSQSQILPSLCSWVQPVHKLQRQVFSIDMAQLPCDMITAHIYETVLLSTHNKIGFWLGNKKNSFEITPHLET